MARPIRHAQDPVSTWAPEDVEAALRRLELAARFALFALTVAALAAPFAQPNVGARAGAIRPFGLIPVGFAMTGALLLALRRPWPLPRKLDAGFTYLILASFCSALFAHWLPYAQGDVVRGVSPSALLGLAFAMLVPAPPRRLTAALVVAAAMDPLALGLTLALGHPAPPPTLWLWLFLPTAGATGVAVLAGRLMHHLGRALAESRAMGAYRLVEKLGEGGMGEVWRATHATLARPAAVKLIRAGQTGDERLRRRFEREARAAASLRSPHTVEVYDFGVTDDGTHYLVMELLEGRDLAAVVGAEGPLAPARVIRLLRQACHSLAEAHAAGLVHRDIKPANLFVCRRGLDDDVLKVLDFGLVRSVDDGGTALTLDGSVSGTPAYIAPEQAQGHDVDGRADLYALGCTAFHLLTGRPPFVGDGPMAVLLAHVQDPPPSPSSLGAAVSPAFDALVRRCLAKDPADRPASAQALAEALEALDDADGDATGADAGRTAPTEALLATTLDLPMP